MTPLTTRTVYLLAVSLLVPSTAAVWLMLRPQTISGSTLAMFSALVIAIGAIAINTWHNAQPTTNTSHVIYATDAAPSNKR